MRTCFLGFFCLLASCVQPDYGTRLVFNQGELFYTDAITESEAVRLGEFLVEDGIFAGDTVSMQIDKENDTYIFRMVVLEGTEKEEKNALEAGFFANQLSAQVFNNAPVDFHFCNNRLETLRVVPFSVTQPRK